MVHINFIDLFCGIGGGRIGFENACSSLGITYKCILSCDIKKSALSIYNRNFNENNQVLDIADIKEVQPFDVILGGFPCQPFSSAGKKEGFNDSRGVLFLEIIRLAKIGQPKLMILENVENLETHCNGNTLKTIIEKFKEINYNCDYKVIDATKHGVPQKRKRIFIIAYRADIELELELHKIPTIITPTLGQFIDQSDNYSDIKPAFLETLNKSFNNLQELSGKSIKDKRGGNDNIHSWDLGIFGEIDTTNKEILNKLLLERRKKHWAKKKSITWMDGMPLTLDEIYSFIKSISKQELKSRLNRLVEMNYLTIEKPKELINGKRDIVDDAEEGYNISKGKLSFPISRFLSYTEYCPTLTATDCCKLAIVLENGVVRKLNRNELKKLCGFPDLYSIENDSMSTLYDVFGNCICPPVMCSVAKYLLPKMFALE